jgi:hypothetical protein
LNKKISYKWFKEIISYIRIMEQVNLLDLDNDILNIIGDYVKRDNESRTDKEDDFEKKRLINNYLKENNKFDKSKMGETLHYQLFKHCHTEEEVKEYVETRRLNRFVKTYNLSKKESKQN